MRSTRFSPYFFLASLVVAAMLSACATKTVPAISASTSTADGVSTARIAAYGPAVIATAQDLLAAYEASPGASPTVTTKISAAITSAQASLASLQAQPVAATGGVVADLQFAVTIARSAEAGYSALPSARPAIVAELEKLDAAASAGIASYATDPTAQGAAVAAVAALLSYTATSALAG